MPRVVADGSLELQDPDNGFDFVFVRGGLDDLPAVRGENVVLPSKPGQTWMPKVEDSMLVTLSGVVSGTPGAGARESYLSRMTTLRAIFNPSAEPFPIVVYPDAEGVGGRLAAGETATILVEFLRFTGLPAMADRWRELEIECRCISDPPTWTIEEESP